MTTSRMARTIGRILKASLPVALAACLLISCVPQKKIKYLQKTQEQDTASFNPRKNTADYRLQARDNLYVRVYTLDEKASLYFNKLSGSSSFNDYANDASIYLNSYTVDGEGYIDFPVVGRVFVKDKTVDQIKAELQVKVDEFLKQTTVVVKTVNFRVTVVGEVMRPGQFTIYDDQYSLFEAIATAGDMTEWANRGKVALIRQEPGGSRVHYLDMNSVGVLSSEYYYLQPNDIIYIAPLGYKRWGLGSVFPWAMVLASVSTTLLLINYFK